ncbi:acyl-CoA dehydrogenase [Neobacillus cucumis]|uniref:acyl-CoA dehydrogenase family protein n=1 Tax=Neobacillus cucumis TaxID=1740721 RepID=UPI0018E000DA|nr:acyl-CoA dehydrogenase [Neobacillus cucumis]MBI0579226.1 acyl-CoA dehydrogenase [Neobacillus cucumis]
MSYELSEQQIKSREQILKYIKNHLANNSYRIETEGIIKHEDIKACKDSGIWDLVLEDGTDWVTKVTLLSEIAKTSPSFAAIFTDLILSKAILVKDLNQHFYATAFVEEEAGSDLTRIQTDARETKDHWILSGEKWFVANLHLAETLLVLAKTPEQSYAIFLVPKDSDGLILEEQKKMGLEGLKLSKIVFNDVSIPKSSLIISLGNSIEGLNQANMLAKLSIASLAIGISEAALRESLERARTRQQFGNAIGEFQAIQFKIADMTVGINGAKTLLYLAAQKLDRKEDIATEAAMAKVYSTEAAGRAVNHAVQIHGAHGVLTDSTVSQLYRSQRLTEIFGQTSEMQRIAIAKHVINTIGVNEREVNYGLSL